MDGSMIPYQLYFPRMPAYIDQLGRNVKVVNTPRRIISLVPSQTELLYNLSLDDEVVGITKFCIHPAAWFKTKKRIGGTKNLHIDEIKTLQPDLIIANKEENEREQIEELALEFPVWISDAHDLESALQMIASVGKMTNREKQAGELVENIRMKFKSMPQAEKRVDACYLIWKDPFMTVGGDTFINDMMQRTGFNNIFSHKMRYPTTTSEEIIASECKLILLPSEPYPFKIIHAEEIEKSTGIRCVLVDGEMFSWYGSRLLLAAGYLRQLKTEIDAIC